MKKLSATLTKKEVIFGIIYMPVQLLGLSFLLDWGNFLMGNPLSDSQLNFLFFALNFIVITVVFRRFLIAHLKALPQTPGRIIGFAAAGFGLYLAGSTLVGILILLLSPDFANANNQYIAQMTQDNMLLMHIGIILLVPVVEEMLYRGVLFGTLYRKNALLGYAVSTFLFSFIHLIGYLSVYTPLELCLSFLQYVPAGIFLAWAYQKTDNIWSSVLIHTAINLIGSLAMR